LMNVLKKSLEHKLKTSLQRFRTVKLSISAYAEFIRDDGDKEFNFQNNTIIIISNDNIQNIINSQLNILNDSIEEEALEGSGYVFLHFNSIRAIITRNTRVRAVSYIDSTKWIKSKQAILNPQNTKDNMCFAWAILADKHRVEHTNHPYRISHYKPFFNELNFTGIEFPVKLSDIPKFEKLNNIAVNVFGYNFNYDSTSGVNEVFCNLHTSIFFENSDEIYKNKIELLLIESDELQKDSNKKESHYAL